MFYPYSSNYYQSDGLNIKEFYATYRKSPNIDIWVNFCHIIKAYTCDFLSIFAKYKRTANSSINLDTLYDNNSKALTYKQAYEAGRTSGDSSSIMIDFNYSISVSNSSVQGTKIGSPEYYPLIYSVHLTQDTIYYYKNGNYLTSTANNTYKYFSISLLKFGGRSSIEDTSTNSTIQWITLTDKMSNEIPQPPYGLNEKDDNMYGIQK